MSEHLAPPSMRIKLFGSMEVDVHGEPLPKLRSRKELWMLALLALQKGRPISRIWLSQTLWPFPDHASDQAAYNLRRSLTNLRTALGQESYRLHIIKPASLSFVMDDAFVDTACFEAAIAREDPESLRDAIRLYSGPLLPECTDSWAAVERENYQQKYLQTLNKLGSHARSCSDFETAIDCLRRALAVDPLWEPATRSLMETLALAGDISAALSVYQEFSRRLHRDRNSFPSEDTTALHYSLRNQLRSRAAPKKDAAQVARELPSKINQLPVPLTPLIGRSDEIIEITARFRKLRLLTLTGIGGIGKTRLAIQLAEENGPEYRDGVCFIDLGSLTDPAEVEPFVLKALDLPENKEEPTNETLISFLRSRQLLLILDNCEHLLGASARLAESLLQNCRFVRILATSRQSLGVSGEGLWRVASLTLPDSAHLSAITDEKGSLLSGYSAVQLFVDRAMLADADFRLTDRNVESVAQICLRLEGIPLALELAAARVRVLSVDQIDERLDDRFRLLAQGPNSALSRQQTLEAAIKWSFDLLDADEGKLLRALSVFAGGWTLETAELVGADLLLVKENVLNILARLVDKSLVIYEPGSGDARFRFLETVRHYCCDKDMNEASVYNASERHLRIMILVTETASRHLQGLEQAQWFDRLETEHVNIRIALDWNMKTSARPDEGLRLAAALWRFWHRRGYLGLGRRHLSELLSGTKEVSSIRAEACIGAGMLAFFQGEAAAARKFFEESRTIGVELGDALLRANALHSMGQMAWNQGEYAEARTLFIEALELQRTLRDSVQIATTLNYLGVITSDAGDPETAQAYFEESLSISRKLKDSRLIASALHGLAHRAFYLADYPAARDYYTEELKIANTLHDRELTARTLHRLGCVEQALKEYPAARSLFEESLFVAEKLGYRDLESAALHSLGSTACAMQDYELARDCFEQRLSISEERGDKPGISYTLDAFASLLAAQNKMESAVIMFAAAQSLRTSLNTTTPINQAEIPTLQAIKSALSEEIFAHSWEAGSAMELDVAISLARQK